MALEDPRPVVPEFVQQDYPKIVYKDPNMKRHDPDAPLVEGQDFVIVNSAEEEAKATATKGKPAQQWPKE